MDTFRYYLAAFLTGLVPAMIVYLLFLHALVGVWRKLGPAVSQTILWGSVLAVFLLVIPATRGAVLADFGTNPFLFACGLALLAAAVWFRLRISQSVGWRTLAGLPEIAPQKFPQALVTGGPYARVRHPRYLQVLVALVGWSLIANHPASYIACALWIPGMWLVAVLEEMELRERFGKEFEDYQRRVPRFIPRRAAVEARA
jgi:protein-S-isoprenylcysteine O-methyltransferase Ste14